MTFKQFFNLSEEQAMGGGGGDNGLMGFPVASSVRKPSDGQPFKDFLGPLAGSKPRGGGATQVAMMKKRMAKK